MTPKKIKLGICMAGAVSAGAYTAGVVDYLMETLERWQIEKDKIREKLARNEELTELEKAVPLHDVEIEVLSGASAGGMTASILTYAMLDGKYVTRRRLGELVDVSYGIPVHSNQKSKLYDAWVEMADTHNQTTLDKMLDTSDVRDIKEMDSALNCDAISEIANRACPERFPDKVKLPPFVSDNLTTYVTVTNLKGLPIDIKFSNTTESKNQYSMHNMLIGFKFGDETHVAHPCMKIGSGNFKKIRDFAIATGAFPFGLKPHKITMSNADMVTYAEFIKKEYGIDIDPNAYHGDDYTFSAVDGGLINNEPYGVNAKHLYLVNPIQENQVDTNFMFYIDPFPSVTNAMKADNNRAEDDTPRLSNMLFKLFGAVRNQSMLKQDDLFHALNMDHNRFMIYPRKNRLYFLACGMLGGFSGFLRKKFRQHDYQLGRKNCQAFLRFYFGQDEQYYQQIGAGLNPEIISAFGYHPDRNESNPIRVPFIPDMLFRDNKNAPEIATPHFENLPINEYQDIIEKIETRLDKILDESYPSLIGKAVKNSKALRLGAFLFKGRIKGAISKKVMGFVDEKLSDIVRPQSIYQRDLVEQYRNVIAEKGGKYFKHKEVFIEAATPNQKVISVTSSGFETEQFAKENQYIVTNITSHRERYLINQGTFEKYDLVDAATGKYRMNSKHNIQALRFTPEYFPKLFSADMKVNELKQRFIYIEAAWGESQVLIENDYLALNGDEIYRIGLLEFEETYRVV
jgi:hypothetical protein